MTRRSLSLHGVDVGLPTAAAVALGLLAGALEVCNEVVLELDPAWHSYLAVALVVLAGVGVSPVTGPAFRAALHLPPWLSYIISAGMAAGVLAFGVTPMSGVAHAVLAGVLTVLAALGFAPARIPAAPPVLARAATLP